MLNKFSEIKLVLTQFISHTKMWIFVHIQNANVNAQIHSVQWYMCVWYIYL